MSFLEMSRNFLDNSKNFLDNPTNFLQISRNFLEISRYFLDISRNFLDKGKGKADRSILGIAQAKGDTQYAHFCSSVFRDCPRPDDNGGQLYCLETPGQCIAELCSSPLPT